MDLNSLIELNSSLIYKIAQKFYGTDIEDLYQAGVMGLIKAYRNYKSDGHTRFTTYAYDYIYGEMYLLVNNKNIKVNRDILKLAKTIEKARYSFAQKIGHIPSNKELSSFLNIDEAKINEATYALLEITSYDIDGNNYLIDSVKDEQNYDNYIMIEDGLSILDENEKAIIKARYFDDLTQSEVAKKLSLSQVKVSRCEKKSLNKMYNYMSV